VSDLQTQPDEETQEYVMQRRDDVKGSMARSWHYRALWIIAAVSFIFNIVLIFGLLNVRDNARRQVTEAADSLSGVVLEPQELSVVIDESLAISLTVPFSDTFIVPVSQTVPVSISVLFEDIIEVPIQENIPINTIVVVPVTIPVIGSLVDLEIPIVTNIPIDLNVEIPISRTIPVDTSIPVVFDVEVPVQSDVPIQAVVPVNMEIPVTVPLDEFGLDDLIGQLEQALRDLAKSLGG
jgi:hypothetical protein